MRNEIELSSVNFHPLLKDIENFSLFFFTAHRVLVNSNVQEIVKVSDDPSFVLMLEKYNQWVDLKIELNKDDTHTSRANILPSMVSTGKIMAISLYEILQASEYVKVIRGDEEYKFLHKIRNGAAHNNKFDLKYRSGKRRGEWMLDEGDSLKFGGLIIHRGLQGTTVFNDLVNLSVVFLLAEHFSNRLKALGLKTNSLS